MLGGGEAASEVAAIATVIGRLAARVPRDAKAWPTSDRRAVLAGMDRAIDSLAALRASVLVAERDSGAWEGTGDRSFEAWRGRTSRTGQRTATTQVRQAEQLDTVPEVTDAVTQGRIGLDHAAIIAKIAATGTDAQRAAARSPEGQEALLDLAGRVDAGTFQIAAGRWAGEIDPDRLERDHEAQRAARYLHLTETVNGTVIKGLLDSFAGHSLALALEAATAAPAADDDRSTEQRRADALTTLAEGARASGDLKPSAHVPPQVSLILTEETWNATQAERDRRLAAAASTATGCGWTATEAFPTVPTTLVSYPPATLQDGTPVPRSELAVTLCDCEITRIVIDANGVPLNAGRSERLFTGEHRWTVIARDRECGWPECHAHARWCQIHHIDWWDRDYGATSIENGVLLCSFHHHEVHRRDLAITRYAIPQPDSAGTPVPRGTMARVRYEFRDPNGRLIGQSPPDTPPDGRPHRREARASQHAAKGFARPQHRSMLGDTIQSG